MDAYEQDLIIKALEDGVLTLSSACRVTGIVYSRAFKHYSFDSEFQARVDSALGGVIERRLDRAEEKLDAAIESGNLTAITFFLKTKGRGRGYGESLSIEHKKPEANIDDMARRIAFAMNTAIIKGKAMDAEFVELLDDIRPELKNSLTYNSSDATVVDNVTEQL